MLRVTGVQKRFGSNDPDAPAAVADVSFELPTGKMLTLLGPSGCGKTTTLRSIAGLETPDGGEIQIGSRVVFSHARGLSVSSAQRRVGMVFQSYAIWPHMTVFENVAFPLRAGGISEREIKKRVERILALVGLEVHTERSAPLLSGGQQQRVALARALVAEPEILLLDEPLSNLDVQLREQMREELRQLQQRVGLTAVYVTHDQNEALAISDVIGVMSGGRLLEIASPQKIYDQPQSRFAAEFIGAANVVPISDPRNVDGQLSGTVPWGELFYSNDTKKPPEFVVIRPEDIRIAKDGEVKNVWPARVEQAFFLGSIYECRLSLQNARLRACLPKECAPHLGQLVRIHVDPDRCVPLGKALVE